MQKMVHVTAIFACTLMAVGSAYGESMEQCMERKRTQLLDSKNERVFSDYGCTTGGTEFVVNWDYQGFRTNSCSAAVCYPAPPGRIILEAKAQDHSAAGSAHSWNGPHYAPDRERAVSVCFNVSARSPDKDVGSRVAKAECGCNFTT